MVLRFCTQHVLFIIVTSFALAVGHRVSNYNQGRLNANETKAAKLSRKKVPDIVDLCQVYWYGRKRMVIRILGLLNRDIPVISHTPIYM